MVYYDYDTGDDKYNFEEQFQPIGECKILLYTGRVIHVVGGEYDRKNKLYFVDGKNGEWYGYLHYDNTRSTTLKGNIFKGPFHIPRLYMIMAILDRDNSIDRYI